MVKQYVPQRGDLVFLNFSPQSGKEQAGRRPALVLSPKIYNQASGLALCCPITKQAKSYPFEVALPSNGKLQGVILSDHIKSIDWQSRNAQFVAKLDSSKLNDVLVMVNTLLFSK